MLERSSFHTLGSVTSEKETLEHGLLSLTAIDQDAGRRLVDRLIGDLLIDVANPKAEGLGLLTLI